MIARPDPVSPRKIAQLGYGFVIQIHSAGESAGRFYVTMEFVDGINLRNWLEGFKPQWWVRWNLAFGILEAVRRCHDDDIYHGDLHAGNILITGTAFSIEYAPDFKLIDFGTSIFSEVGFSQERHWKLFTDTMNELLKPFTIDQLWAHRKPANLDPNEMCNWYNSFLHTIHALVGRHRHRPVLSRMIQEEFPHATRTRLEELLRGDFIDAQTLAVLSERYDHDYDDD